jgi:Golgi phosphoprotein 3 (GPP34)
LLLLANDFFLIAHDTISMKCRLAVRVVRLGLAGALLCEQVLFRRITVRGGQIRIVDERPPGDALAHTILDHLRAEPEITSVRDWMRFLSRDAYEHVGQRLLRDGVLQAREVRRFLRMTIAFEPTNTTRVGWPESRLAHGLSAGLPIELPDVALAGLVDATGLDTYVLADAPPQARLYLRQLLEGLPPSLRDVVDETAAAIGDAVLNART